MAFSRFFFRFCAGIGLGWPEIDRARGKFDRASGENDRERRRIDREHRKIDRARVPRQDPVS
ncbi:hypothetical protein [Lentibacillus kimchii]|uniref:hypothetical protein n=1 Tax=Lentibacillus kimchii TaxID=1542911 RepID=UPI0036D33333